MKRILRMMCNDVKIYPCSTHINFSSTPNAFGTFGDIGWSFNEWSNTCTRLPMDSHKLELSMVLFPLRVTIIHAFYNHQGNKGLWPHMSGTDSIDIGCYLGQIS